MQLRKNIPVKEGDVTMLTGDLLRVRVRDITPEHVQQIKKIQSFFDVKTSSDKKNASDVNTTTKKTKQKNLPAKTIEPIFISVTSKKQLQRAQSLLEIFSTALIEGVSYQSIENSIREMAQFEVDHKVLHGFAKVLFNRCHFQSPSVELNEIISPSEVRQMVFLLAAQKRKDTSIGELGELRNEIFKEVLVAVQQQFLFQREEDKTVDTIEIPSEKSEKYEGKSDSKQSLSIDKVSDLILSHLKPSSIEAYMYADLKENHVLYNMDNNTPKSAESLISRYNLSLCQSLLLRATELDVYIDLSGFNDGTTENTLKTSKWLRFIFRHIKFQQLMYRIWEVEPQSKSGLYHIRIDGPQSIFQKSSRYGMQLALFLPALVLFPGKWYARATVLWGKKRKMKRLFCLSNKSNLVSHYQTTGLWRSSAEENFELRFQYWLEKEYKKSGVELQWTLDSGRIFCLEDGRLCISDFTLKHPLGNVNVEILGYWRKKETLSIKRRPKKENYIFVVSKNFVSDKAQVKGKKEEDALMKKGVIVFRDIIPIKKIMECARALLKIS